MPKVDNIYVLANGEISETGSYEELLSSDGDFAQFLKAHLTNEDDTDFSDKVEVLDRLWVNYRHFKCPSSLQSICGQEVRERMKSRADVHHLGLPQQVLCHVTQTELAQQLWGMMKECQDSKLKYYRIVNTR